jgi:hypothetical protein
MKIGFECRLDILDPDPEHFHRSSGIDPRPTPGHVRIDHYAAGLEKPQPGRLNSTSPIAAARLIDNQRVLIDGRWLFRKLIVEQTNRF